MGGFGAFGPDVGVFRASPSRVSWSEESGYGVDCPRFPRGKLSIPLLDFGQQDQMPVDLVNYLERFA